MKTQRMQIRTFIDKINNPGFKVCPICGKELIKYETQFLFDKKIIQIIWYCSDINCSHKQEEKITGVK